MKRLLFSALPIFLVGAPVLADDEADDDVYEMGEMIITGSKLPQTPGNVTQKISIITADEMGSLVLGNGNLAEMLSYIPGNFANVLSRNDANWGSSGGLAHTYKGYMLDGLPIDAFVDLQSLDPWAFQRVEDQRGPASVLYPNYLAMDFAGNQSPLAGTANFILKERVGSTRTSASAYYGSFNTIGGRAFRQQAFGDFHMFAGAHYEGSDYTDYGTEGSWLNMIDNPEYKKAKAYVRGTYFLNDNGLRASLYAHRTLHTGDAGRPNRGFDHAYTTLNAGVTNPFSDRMVVRAKVGYRDYVRRWEEDNFRRDDDGMVIPTSLSLRSEDGVDQRVIPADLSLSVVHREDDVLTVGADYQLASYETSSDPAESGNTTIGNDATATSYGVYAQEELHLNQFVLRAGGRYNGTAHSIDLLQGDKPGDDSNSWSKFLWSAGIRYNDVADDFSIYTNWGTTFKAPSLKSVGGTIPIDSKDSGHLPNPDIKSESGSGWDLGVSYSPLEGLRLGLRGFVIGIEDQIVQREVPVEPDDPSQSQDINAGNTMTNGVELEVIHRLNQRVEWFANYTLTKAKVTENPEDPGKVGAKINFVPESALSTGVYLTLPQGLHASISVQSYTGIYSDVNKDAQPFDGYMVVNARIDQRFQFGDKYDLHLYLEPYNFTDEIADNTFEMPWQFQDTGFSANGGLMVSF